MYAIIDREPNPEKSDEKNFAIFYCFLSARGRKTYKFCYKANSLFFYLKRVLGGLVVLSKLILKGDGEKQRRAKRRCEKNTLKNFEI